MQQSNFDDLKGKCCVITGGAGVICSAIASCLCAAGANVALIDLRGEEAARTAAQIKQATGGETIGLAANVLDKESIASVKKTVNEQLGPVDILINGAGGNNPKATTGVESMSDQDLGNLDQTFFGLDIDGFRSAFDLNFMGTLLPTMAFGRDMVERKRGAILNISSMNSFRPLTRIAAYSAAKASINNFTAWLAVHLAKQNVRVNAIAPGFLLTDQNRFLLTDRQTGALSQRGAKVIAATPMGRFGAPEELQGAVLYLVSDLSKFVTGVVLPIDGGFNAYSGV